MICCIGCWRTPTRRPGQMFNQLFAKAKQVAGDAEVPAEVRQDAIKLLGYGKFQDVQGTLSALLDPRQPQEVQSAVVHAWPNRSNRKWPRFPWPLAKFAASGCRGEMADALLSQKDWIVAFLDAVKAQKVSGAMIGNTRRSLLLMHPDPAIRDRATPLFADTGLKPRDE